MSRGLSENERSWNEHNSKRSDYIHVPHGINPYDYDKDCGLAQIFKFGFRQAVRCVPYSKLNGTEASAIAFKKGYDAAANKTNDSL